MQSPVTNDIRAGQAAQYRPEPQAHIAADAGWLLRMAGPNKVFEELTRIHAALLDLMRVGKKPAALHASRRSMMFGHALLHVASVFTSPECYKLAGNEGGDSA